MYIPVLESFMSYIIYETLIADVFCFGKNLF